MLSPVGKVLLADRHTRDRWRGKGCAAFTCFFHFVSSRNFKQEHSDRAPSLSRAHLSQLALVEAAVPRYRVEPAVVLSCARTHLPSPLRAAAARRSRKR